MARFGLLALGLLALISRAEALDNGVGRTPSMGWNSWNAFRCDINEARIREVADALVSSGLAAAGYRYVVLDDCWMEKRDESGTIVPFASKFPSGMRALGEYIHARGLRFGLYSNAGRKTCEGFPGGWEHEVRDAQLYATWGVDYLKYDFCDTVGLPGTPRQIYERMSAALNATGRPMVFSLCNWGVGEPHSWGAQLGHSWRTGRDVFAAWDEAHVKALKLPAYLQSVTEAIDGIIGRADVAAAVAPGGFNDPDMLVVGLDEGMFACGAWACLPPLRAPPPFFPRCALGLAGGSPRTPPARLTVCRFRPPRRACAARRYGIATECPEHIRGCKPGEYISRERWGKVGGLTRTEQEAHFAMWAFVAAPLMLGNDPRSLSAHALRLLTSAELIAINQDPLALPARRTWVDAQAGAGVEVWTRPLAGGRVALLALNRGSAPARSVTLVFARDAPEAHERWAHERELVDPCADRNVEARLCKAWAQAGECTRNPGFMAASCEASCALCTPLAEPRLRVAVARARDASNGEELGVWAGGVVVRNLEPHAARVLVLTFGRGELGGSADEGLRAGSGALAGVALPKLQAAIVRLAEPHGAEAAVGAGDGALASAEASARGQQSALLELQQQQQQLRLSAARRGSAASGAASLRARPAAQGALAVPAAFASPPRFGTLPPMRNGELDDAGGALPCMCNLEVLASILVVNAFLLLFVACVCAQQRAAIMSRQLGGGGGALVRSATSVAARSAVHAWGGRAGAQVKDA